MKELIMAFMELDNIDVRIEGYVIYHVDKNYGQDADNKRGESRTFVDDVVEIKAYDPDMDDVPLSVSELDRAAEILTREFLEN